MGTLEGLNEQQAKAAAHFEKPLLILAGAGSGKTRVLTNRIAWLIEEKHVQPWNILAITFTNKAAGEMRERVNRMVACGADAVWVATFHSTCARILRRYIDCIGYQTNFTIYDTDDQKTLMKDVCKRLNIDTKVLKERAILAAISAAKNELIGPEEFARTAGDNYTSVRIAAAYRQYQADLKKNNALDFDDLLMKTVELFEQKKEVLEQYRARFQFIMVDEYQDTNTAQFRMVSLLAGDRGNLCVVGDDDQSIYGFRGANIENILSFEKIYPDTEVIKLEQNYRSTQSILDAANVVIANNRGRKQKKLWTANGMGDPVRVWQFSSAYEEAEQVAYDIGKCVRSGEFHYGDFAILYRTNAQSRLMEEKLLLSNIPYKIVGGLNFYARKEIKDLLSYLKTVANGSDDLAVRRIINVPKRGIGAATITKIQQYADINDKSFCDCMLNAREIPGMGRSAAKLDGFANMIRVLRSKAGEYSVLELLNDIIEETGYIKELELEGTDEAKDRINNIHELINKVVSYQENAAEDASLDGFLEEVSLVADVDSLEDETDRVTLMTLHSAKGLEFPNVYLTGMEDGLFPSFMAISEENSGDAVEEERRLCYVGITRAMQRLTLTCAQSRMHNGQMQYNRKSRFLEEIPEEMTEVTDFTYGGYRRQAKRDENSSSFAGSDSSFSFGGSGRSAATAQTEFRQAKKNFKEKAFDPSMFKVKKADSLEYGAGDRVSHVKFGEGTVLSVADIGKDYEVVVDFDRPGQKKLLAAFAKLKKI